ncbi:MAG: glutathione S-transferase N-terminal domain-containing protein [Polyangiaceae bacterium]
MSRAVEVVSSYASSVAFGGAGMRAIVTGEAPEKALELYEFEACPFCRKVRVALSEMDLDAMVYPCPKNGPRYREEVRRRGGKAQFPYLVDPNTGREMFESDDIVRYLAETYRGGKVPVSVRLGAVSTGLSMMASAARPTRGGRYRGGRAPEKALELYSFEASPYCRLAREALSELEVPYLLHNVAKGSPRREAFVARSGKMMVPYLVDPNTGREMFESGDIVRYLNETYGG